MTAVSQTRFAALAGYSKSWVTALKQRGRLVLTEDGRVDVEASLARIRETAEPGRADVAERWARARAGQGGAAADDDRAEPEAPDAAAPTDGTMGFQHARARKEHFLAKRAEAEYGEMIGELTRAAEVRDMGTRLGALVRTHLERLEVLADVLAAESDATRVRAHIAEHAELALGELSEAVARLAREAEHASH